MDVVLLLAAAIVAWSAYRSWARTRRASLQEHRQMLADDRRLMQGLMQGTGVARDSGQADRQ